MKWSSVGVAIVIFINIAWIGLVGWALYTVVQAVSN